MIKNRYQIDWDIINFILLTLVIVVLFIILSYKNSSSKNNIYKAKYNIANTLH